MIVQGMQANPGVRTIEGDLAEALASAGAITAEDAAEPSRVRWTRAARTDKGVSALGQVVSANLAMSGDNVATRVNRHLPPTIRVLGVRRASPARRTEA